MTTPPEFKDLPGADLVAAGLCGLERGDVSVESLLVSVGTTRLRSLGIAVPRPPGWPHPPEPALYEAVAEQSPGGAHSRYNALIRRLVSFERALAARRERSRQPAPDSR